VKLRPSIVTAYFLVFVVFALLFFIPMRAFGADAPVVHRRVAIIVGANAPPPGRAPLRFAYDDARTMVDVLTRVGHFAPADVHQLLDPSPVELLQAIDEIAKSASDDAMVLFYYSGHSDGQSLYPHGEALPLTDVRERLSRMAARVRVGVLDTCRGGNWTQAKGVSVGPPLDPVDLLNVATEGTALVSSSSGFEAAHEAEDAHGSFFTHYFAAGLLGAADVNGDGEVTLEEAYEYARERTVRDSARLAPTPQHPSFDIDLRGRQDIVLASLRDNTSAIEIDQPESVVEVIHLPTGITLAEVPPSARVVHIAVPPARYLVRRVALGRVYSKEVEVAAGETVTLAPGQLEATGTSALAMKGGPCEPVAALNLWTPTHGEHWLLESSIGLGTQYWPLTTGGAGATGGQPSHQSFISSFDFWYRPTERLSLAIPFPGIAYRFGDPGGVEVMTKLMSEFNGFTLGTDASASAGLFGEVATRFWTANNQQLTMSASLYAPVYTDPSTTPAIGNDLYPAVYGGYSLTLGRIVTLNAGLGYQQDYYRGALTTDWLQPSGSIWVRTRARTSMGIEFLYADELYRGQGLSYESVSLGTALAF
jgi:hypothetical protein